MLRGIEYLGKGVGVSSLGGWSTWVKGVVVPGLNGARVPGCVC